MINKSLTISVIIPTYKRHHEVQRAIRSALVQTLPPLEVVVVNDGPDPEKARLIAALGDDRVRFHEAPRRGNASATRNFGIRQAQGDWIALLDDDDIWLPQKLESQFDALANAGLSEAILGAREAVYFKGRHLHDRPRKPVPAGVPVDELLFCGYGGVNTSTLVAPTKTFREHAFNEEYEVQEDMSWMLHAGQVLPVIVADEVVCERHLAPGEGLSRPGGVNFSRAWYASHYDLMSPSARAGFVTDMLSKQAASDGKFAMLPWLIKELRHQNGLSLGGVWRLWRPWLVPRRARLFLRRVQSRVRAIFSKLSGY